ncbi:CotH kinase family protein [Haloferula sp. BvORR071]|uniref:CotH kinase family protein n=1 Tax=Haloferula sp. BvORR071 TaxID=1396141 RepID=UPI00054D40A8|nr:CotH kinase family protein [Haloferula sp. BvORR071]
MATQTYLFLNDVLANQNYPAGTAPAGWPSSSVNGQAFRYGWNSTLKAQYSTQQLIDGLKQIPTVSLVTEQGNLTGVAQGIYVNSGLKGDEWERPVSMEYLPADGSDGFRIDAGLRIRGGASRGDAYVKHSLRLHFRGSYGESTLKFALHGSSGTDEFDTLDLRTEQNYHWANSSGTENTAVREVFCRDLMAAMGQPTTRSRYVQLYLNGQYWGIYQTEERAQEDYGASYFGGKADDYDVIQTSNHPSFTYELSSGQVNAWQTMWSLARTHAGNPSAANYFVLLGRNADGQRNPALPVYVDLDNLITYMLVNYYTGDGDAPLSNFLSMNRANNWRGMRNRNGTEGFRYFVHDSEHTLQAPSWVDNRPNTSAPNGSNRSSFTYSNPEWIHEDLAVNPEYRIRFADIAQKALFNGGAMTAFPATTLFDARAAQISQAIVPDAARWGSNATNHTLAQWQSRINSIRSSFFLSRQSSMISYLRTRGFYPAVSTPVFSQRGGSVGADFMLTLSSGGGGTIYYTLDGSDPRAIGGAVAGTANTYGAGIPINGVVTVRTRYRSAGGIWSALDEARFIGYPPAVAGDLVISKIHYHPDNPSEAEKAAGFQGDSEFEYVELLNIGDHTVDLSAVAFMTGIGFNFGTSPIVTLAAGARVLVAKNPAALQVRYGPGLPVAGAYSDELSNAGETLRLAGTANATLKEFAYDDVSPWPLSADGDGSALVLKGPASNPAAGQGGNWRASNVRGGRPGAADLLDRDAWRGQNFAPEELADVGLEATLWGDEADPDGDGVVNLMEMVRGTSPGDENPRPEPEGSWWTDPGTQERYFTVGFRVREDLDLTAVTISAQGSSDLEAWPDSLERVGAPVPQGDGTVMLWFREAAPDGGQRFVRIQVSVP